MPEAIWRIASLGTVVDRYVKGSQYLEQIDERRLNALWQELDYNY